MKGGYTTDFLELPTLLNFTAISFLTHFLTKSMCPYIFVEKDFNIEGLNVFIKRGTFYILDMLYMLSN